MGPCHTTFSGLVSGIYEKLLTFHCSVNGRCGNILLIPNCFSTWSIRLFLNSVLLSDRIYLGHMWTGKYWLIKVETNVSADLSGIRKASGQPVRGSIIVRICIFPELEVLHSVIRSMTNLSNGLSGISVI